MSEDGPDPRPRRRRPTCRCSCAPPASEAAVVGGGLVAARRVETLARAGALVSVYAPRLDEEEFAPLARALRLHPCRARTDARRSRRLRSSATSRPASRAADERLHAALAGAGPPISVADRPDLSDFISPSILDRSPLVVAVSTGGASPMLGRMLRARLETLIPAAYGGLAAFAGRMRARVNDKLRSPVARRRFWERVLDGPIAELALARNEPAAEAAFAEALDRAAEGGEGPSLGEVYLVGAGPGDADLLTFRALRLMQKADVVLYDRLVDPSIVDLARREAERIYVGKRRADHALPQEEISDLLVRLAREGKRVLRLKGGDPFIFGRGGEEIEKLAEHGIPFQVCPGVTAATACAAYAGIPLTHRDHAQACVFVTGHGRDGPLDLDWETLDPAQPNGGDLHGPRPSRRADAGLRRPRRRPRPARGDHRRRRAREPARRRRDARRPRRQGARGEPARPDDRHRRHGRVAAREAELVRAGSARLSGARFAAAEGAQ